MAIYNSVTLDIPFPLALYKKLLHKKPSLDDLIELDPALGNGLQSMLNFEGDMEDVFGWTFQIEYDDVFGQGRKKYDLKPDGENIKLTHQNKKEFIDLYISFIFDISVMQAFGAFLEGFELVIDGSVLPLFRPPEFQELVVGNPVLDFIALGIYFCIIYSL